MARRTGGDAATQGDYDKILRWLLPAALLLFALNAARFITSSPSVTDVAHLQAVTLPIGRLIAWIAGSPDAALVPAPSRTVSLPLLLDWIFWRIIPFGIGGLRVAHIVIALAGFAVLLRAMSLRMNDRAAVVAGIVIALSPRLVEAVTALGPSPYVLPLFCWQLAILMSRGKIGGPVPLMLFVGIGGALGLCGMTGILASASLFIAMLASAADGGDARRRVLMTLLVLPVWVSPLAFTAISGVQADALSWRAFTWLITKVLAHNADLVWFPAGIALVGGMFILVALGFGSYMNRFTRNGPSERGHSFALIFVATLAGCLLILLVGPILRLYVWTDTTAQTWLSLLIIILAAAAFAPRLVANRPAPRGIRMAATALMIMGAMGGTIILQLRANWFEAGPEANLERSLQAAGKNRALIYAGSNWGRIYFPHAWPLPSDNEQWILSLDGKMVMHLGPDAQLGDPQPLETLRRYNALVVVRIDRRNWQAMNAVRDPLVIGAAPPASLNNFPTYWQPDAAQAMPGEYWLTSQILRKYRDL